MTKTEEPIWYICTTKGCFKEVPARRVELGYRTCFECGTPKKKYTVGPSFNKGPNQLITPSGVKDMGKK